MLLDRIGQVLGRSQSVFDVTLDVADGAGLAWAYAHGRVLDRCDRAEGVALRVAVDPQHVDSFLARFGDKIALEEAVRRAS